MGFTDEKATAKNEIWGRRRGFSETTFRRDQWGGSCEKKKLKRGLEGRERENYKRQDGADVKEHP